MSVETNRKLSLALIVTAMAVLVFSLASAAPGLRLAAQQRADQGHDISALSEKVQNQQQRIEKLEVFQIVVVDKLARLETIIDTNNLLLKGTFGSLIMMVIVAFLQFSASRKKVGGP
jgi:hypothetical protein